MSFPSTYSFRQSLPNRSPSLRPRSLSLADYAPLSFDRETLEAQYYAALSQPSSATVSSGRPSAFSVPSFPSSGTGLASGTGAGYSGGSDQTHSTQHTRGDGSTPSTLSHNLRRGDNPHTPPQPAVAPQPVRLEADDEPANYAGVGAGHALTPPTSPLHKDVQQVHQAMLDLQGLPSPAAERQDGTRPPTPPPRPAYIPASTFHPSSPISDDGGFRRHVSDMYIDEDGAGYLTDPGSGRPVDRNKGKRRQLPPPPTNVPVPVSLGLALALSVAL